MCCASCLSQNVLKTNYWVHILPHPFLNLMWCEKIMKVVNNCHAVKNSHVLLVHIFQYFLIIWGRGEMIIFRIKGMTFTLQRHLWSQMKINKNCLGGVPFYIAIVKILSYILKSYIPLSLHLSPLLWGWFFLHHSTYV